MVQEMKNSFWKSQKTGRDNREEQVFEHESSWKEVT